MVEIATPTTNAGFNADWASPPVDLIEEVLEELGLTRAELAQRLVSAQRGREPSVRRMSLSSSSRCKGSVGERSNSATRCS
jgi:hypothetical protein